MSILHRFRDNDLCIELNSGLAKTVLYRRCFGVWAVA